MRINELLIPLHEAIQSPLYQQGYQAVQEGIQPWLEQFIIPLVNQYTNKAQYEVEKHSFGDQYDSDNYEQLARLRDNQYDREYKLLVRDENPALHQKLVETFKNMLDEQLRTAALTHIENQFGKVEQLQHLIVDIDYQSQYKSGQPRTGGGFFTANAMSQKWSGEKWSDQYSQTINWESGEPAMAIKIYVSENRLWLAAVGTVIEHLHIEHFGEKQSENDNLNDLLQEVLPTWAHEVVHLEQAIRLRVKGTASGKPAAHWGMSYTPMNKPRPKFRKYDPGTGAYMAKKSRGGRRGYPSHLSSLSTGEPIEEPEWIEYFGSAHEIEAYAAGTAAELLHEILQNNQGYGYDRQHQINRDIDSFIQDIAQGYYPNVESLNNYHKYIRDQGYKLLRLRKWKDERTLNKINIGARKAWTQFLSKCVKHLQAYKKPVNTYSERDPRLRTPEIRKPQLPDSPQ